MNFLELCQKVNTFGAFQGTITSVNASGYQGTLVDAVRKSWIEIQDERADWKFLRRSEDISVSDATNIYTPTTIFGDTDTLGTWETKRVLYDYAPLRYIKYDDFILVDPSGSASKPTYFTVRPEDDALLLNTLDNSYTVTAHYYRAPQILVNNTDEPIIPKKHHWIIVYAACIELSTIVSNLELYQRASLLYSKAMGQLMREQVRAKQVKPRPVA